MDPDNKIIRVKDLIHYYKQDRGSVGVDGKIRVRIPFRTPLNGWYRGGGVLCRAEMTDGLENANDETNKDCQIRGTGMQSTARRMDQILRKGQVYEIQHFVLVKKNPCFITLRHSLEIKFVKETIFTPVQEATLVIAHKLYFDYTLIGDLDKIERSSRVDILAVIKKVGDVIKWIGKDPDKTKPVETLKEFYKRELILLDRSGYELVLTLCQDRAKYFSGKEGQIYLGHNVKVVVTVTGIITRRRIAMLLFSDVEVDPVGFVFDDLRIWYEQEGQFMQFDPIQLYSERAILKKLKVYQVQEEPPRFGDFLMMRRIRILNQSLKIVLQCKYCLSTCGSSLHEMETHLKYHSENGAKCPQCTFVPPFQDEYGKHLNVHSKIYEMNGEKLEPFNPQVKSSLDEVLEKVKVEKQKIVIKIHPPQNNDLERNTEKGLIQHLLHVNPSNEKSFCDNCEFFASGSTHQVVHKISYENEKGKVLVPFKPFVDPSEKSILKRIVIEEKMEESSDDEKPTSCQIQPHGIGDYKNTKRMRVDEAKSFTYCSLRLSRINDPEEHLLRHFLPPNEDYDNHQQCSTCGFYYLAQCAATHKRSHEKNYVDQSGHSIEIRQLTPEMNEKNILDKWSEEEIEGSIIEFDRIEEAKVGQHVFSRRVCLKRNRNLDIQCTICLQVFKSDITKFERHLKCHAKDTSGHRNAKCHYCPYYNQASAVSNHQKCHTVKYFQVGYNFRREIIEVRFDEALTCDQLKQKVT